MGEGSGFGSEEENGPAFAERNKTNEGGSDEGIGSISEKENWSGEGSGEGNGSANTIRAKVWDPDLGKKIDPDLWKVMDSYL